MDSERRPHGIRVLREADEAEAAQVAVGLVVDFVARAAAAAEVADPAEGAIVQAAPVTLVVVVPAVEEAHPEVAVAAAVATGKFPVSRGQ